MKNEKILSSFEISKVSERFPNFELSYETISHKKVSPNYNLGIAIPSGKKYYAWFSFYKNQNVLFIFELNKEKKIVKVSTIPCNFHNSLSLGTLLYGVILPDTDVFIIEDIYSYKGILLKKMNFGEKLYYIHNILENSLCIDPNYILFTLPILWYKNHEIEDIYKIPSHLEVPYTIHHIQYRSLSEISPFLNFQLNKKPNERNNQDFIEIQENNSQMQMQNTNKHLDNNNNNNNHHEKINKPAPMMISLIPDFTKPQYKYPTIFKVCADIQYDIYHLFAYGKNKTSVYYNVAYISNYKISIFMNKLFRNIKENLNLDYIEESDDEDDFENIREDKYVDLQKILYIECNFHQKFKKWIPIRVVQQPCKVVHISQLVKNY